MVRLYSIPFTSEQFLIGAGVVLILLFLAAVLLIKKEYAKPYERVSSILTPPEQYFYKVLSSTLQGRVFIFSKVRIADIIKVRRSISRKNFWRHFSAIRQKHIDFVLVDPKTFTTICLIELDDKSHLRLDRIKRDRFVNHIMKQTEIPLYRFRVQRRYDRAEILRMLEIYTEAKRLQTDS